ncbi:MAG: hypothetical protein AVDCRST_MAG49-573, partial [uncultured Thermomicrobiales bacterium]
GTKEDRNSPNSSRRSGGMQHGVPAGGAGAAVAQRAGACGAGRRRAEHGAPGRDGAAPAAAPDRPEAQRGAGGGAERGRRVPGGDRGVAGGKRRRL